MPPLLPPVAGGPWCVGGVDCAGEGAGVAFDMAMTAAAAAVPTLVRDVCLYAFAARNR